MIKEIYAAEYKKYQNVDHILSLAFTREDGIIDYMQLFEAIVPEMSENIRQKVDRFFQQPYVKYFPEYAKRKNEGDSFDDMLRALESDGRFYSSVVDIALLMMKLFAISMDEFFQKRATLHGAVSLSAAERIMLSVQVWEQVFAEDET
jgi:hypothetical protein